MTSVSALSTLADSAAAFEAVAERALAGLGGRTADLAVLFATKHHAESLEQLGRQVRARGIARHLVGCTGESIVGEDREVEDAPALSLWAICLPGVKIDVRRLSFDRQGLHGMPSDDETNPPEVLIVLGDPFSFPADEFLKAVQARSTKLPVVGGMASAGQSPGGNRLILDDDAFENGAVAVALRGPVTVRTVVSQGCRPIGRTMIVTRAERNVIRELGRRPALEVLREVFDDLPPEDQERVQQGLHIGRVINEYQETFQRGDFLVRNVIGADDSGGIAVTDVIRVGQTVQFHVRDADSADEDLRAMLSRERLARPQSHVGGALLFTCNGRGTRLFNAPNHDVRVLHEILGPVPVAGFFAMGELGPVGGQNFVHGFTASVVLFEPIQEAEV